MGNRVTSSLTFMREEVALASWSHHHPSTNSTHLEPIRRGKRSLYCRIKAKRISIAPSADRSWLIPV